MLTPAEQYDRLPPETQRLLDEINFLAAELRDHLLLEQFYLALNALNARLQQLHPEIACVQGCSTCCQTQGNQWQLLPMEWSLIQRALQALPQAQQLRVQSQLQQLADPASGSSCPLLLDGRCAVYAFRPLDCRLKGYSFSQERLLPMQPALPQAFSCLAEQQRILHDLKRPGRALFYMFFPQREALQQVLQRIEPSDDQSQTLAHWLEQHFEALHSAA
ncbi:MAG: YkgJ family cysteine cluster protein [Candidatus Sericytochromatia bacterium]|nr:YkgJ family cysteine cluster protein [Candidatus Sericytochromatia bacterium]